MKKNLLSGFLIFVFSIAAFSQGTGKANEKTLLIMHPTVSNISGITTLIEEGIFPVKDILLKGVYFEKEAYDYEASERFIKEHQLNFELVKVEGEVKPDDLFGLNVLTKVFEQLFNESSGVIFYGGPDIPPSVYGEKTSTLTVITDPYRHYFEASFLFHLLGGSQDKNYLALLEKKPEYLIVGFCLGMQTMNVATGGTMIQDIPREVYKKTTVEDILLMPVEKRHRNYANNIEDDLQLFWGNIHPIKAKPDSWLIKEGLINPGHFPGVVSSHHQAVDKIGLNFRLVATSMDGKIIEAVDHLKYPNVFGFQFHPEVLDIYNYDNSYRFAIGENEESLRSRIEKGGGYEFHKALWNFFAEILNKE